MLDNWSENTIIDLRVLYLILPYNWLVSTITRLWRSKIKSFTGLKQISFIIISGNAGLLGNIINKISYIVVIMQKELFQEKLSCAINENC